MEELGDAGPKEEMLGDAGEPLAMSVQQQQHEAEEEKIGDAGEPLATSVKHPR